MLLVLLFISFFFFNDTATTEIYTLSLHDALPIYISKGDLIDYYLKLAELVLPFLAQRPLSLLRCPDGVAGECVYQKRSEEHTSELQSQSNLVCRLLLEKKKKQTMRTSSMHSHVYN